jgi:hypothetical protein
MDVQACDESNVFFHLAMGLVSCNPRVQEEWMAYTMTCNLEANFLSQIVDLLDRLSKKRINSQYLIRKENALNQISRK